MIMVELLDAKKNNCCHGFTCANQFGCIYATHSDHCDNKGTDNECKSLEAQISCMMQYFAHRGLEVRFSRIGDIVK